MDGGDCSVSQDDPTEDNLSLASSVSSHSTVENEVGSKNSDVNSMPPAILNNIRHTPTNEPHAARMLNYSPIPRETSISLAATETPVNDTGDGLGATGLGGSSTQEDSKPPAAIVTTAKKPRRTNSIMHGDYVEGKCVFFSVDVETGGEDCGIIQLSAVEIDFEAKQPASEFDTHINPGRRAKWSREAIATHGIKPSDARIKPAGTMETVWPKFVEHNENRLDGGTKKGVIVAWNGKSCDLKWMFHVVDNGGSDELRVPRLCPYFMDPMHVITNHKSCKLNEAKCPPERQGNSLEAVWSCINNKDWLPCPR